MVTGILQGMVLTMCISFEIRDWKKRKNDATATEPANNGFAHGERRDRVFEDHTEHTSLLGNER